MPRHWTTDTVMEFRRGLFQQCSPDDGNVISGRRVVFVAADRIVVVRVQPP